MVKAKSKPLEEIREAIKRYRKVLNVGCGGCVSVCLAGGQKEVIETNTELNLLFKLNGEPTRLDGYTTERQCNMRFLQELDEIVQDYDCLLSMACGAGAQLLAERFPDKPVFPLVNTTSIGVDRDIGVYEERCRACGECVIGYTGGICPVSRCAKGLFNGPCGGTHHGTCEVDPETPCCWFEIYERLKRQNRLDNLYLIRPPMEWQNQVPRTTVQEKYRNRYRKR